MFRSQLHYIYSWSLFIVPFFPERSSIWNGTIVVELWWSRFEKLFFFKEIEDHIQQSWRIDVDKTNKWSHVHSIHQKSVEISDYKETGDRGACEM